MPGVDDGASNDDEARYGLTALREAGVGTIATTPHVNASALARRSWAQQAAALDAAWERLVEIGAETVPDVTLHRGAEVRLDIPDPDLSDPRVRLGGGQTALVEFAYFTIPPFSERLVERLRTAGWIPVIAHPERYRGYTSAVDVVGQWRDAGAIIQVNAGSLTGRYGAEPKSIARNLLARGWIDCIASDYHARGAPELTPAREWLRSMGAESHAALLLDSNPARILEGQEPVPVPPLIPKEGLLSRMLTALRGGRT